MSRRGGGRETGGLSLCRALLAKLHQASGELLLGHADGGRGGLVLLLPTVRCVRHQHHRSSAQAQYSCGGTSRRTARRHSFSLSLSPSRGLSSLSLPLSPSPSSPPTSPHLHTLLSICPHLHPPLFTSLHLTVTPSPISLSCVRTPQPSAARTCRTTGSSLASLPILLPTLPVLVHFPLPFHLPVPRCCRRRRGCGESGAGVHCRFCSRCFLRFLSAT